MWKYFLEPKVLWSKGIGHYWQLFILFISIELAYNMHSLEINKTIEMISLFSIYV